MSVCHSYSHPQHHLKAPHASRSELPGCGYELHVVARVYAPTDHAASIRRLLQVAQLRCLL